MPGNAESARLELLESRVDRVEAQYRSDIGEIHRKIDALSALVSKSFVESAKNACPSPGLCLTLNETVKGQIAIQNSTMLRVERLEIRILAMEKWQGRIIGGMAILVFLLTIFAPAIRKMLSLE